MARLFSFKPAITLKGRKFKGLRGWAGKPFHPPLTDLPVACYVLVAVFDVISYFKGYADDVYSPSGVAHDFFAAGTYVIVAGAIASVGAIVTGFWDWWKGVDRDSSTGALGKAKHTQAWRTINAHMVIMLTTSVVVVIDIFVRLGQSDDTYARLPAMVLSLLAAGLVSIGSTYGGSMVFDYQFNVESLEGSTVWDETEVDQLPGHKTQKGE